MNTFYIRELTYKTSQKVFNYLFYPQEPNFINSYKIKHVCQNFLKIKNFKNISLLFKSIL